jgi:DNA invertase Pin-like site-specific DNA recombinase
MSTHRRLAISYSRFSSPLQARGDSEDRQARMFCEFCTRHNLTPLTEVFADRGRSGYHDEHRRKGRLGQLVAMAKDGRFDPGTVIVVEAWDRLGRLRPDKMTALIAELVQCGLGIGVCRLDDTFTEEDFGTHKWTTLAVFVQLAYQESKQKSERVAASWDRRRARAREKGILATSQLPAWLEYHDGKARPIPERVAVVRRIFKLAAEGYGHKQIIKALERDQVPAFGEYRVNPHRSRSQFSGRWTKPYVAIVLNDRRAVGEYQYRKDNQSDGPPIANFLPAAVTEEQFLLARAGQEKRTLFDKRGRTLTPREVRHVNVFRGLLRHARDNEGFVLHNKGTQAKPELSLLTASGESGRSNCYSMPYLVFEQAILKYLRELDPADVFPSEGESHNRADSLRAQLGVIRADLAQLQADLQSGYSKALANVLRKKEQQEQRVAEQLQEELARSVRPASRAWKDVPSLVERIAKEGDEARLKLRTALRRTVESIWVLIVRKGATRLAAVQVYFHGGAHRDYLIRHRTAGNQRKEEWESRSFASEAGGFDLRNPKDATELVQVLEKLK